MMMDGAQTRHAWVQGGMDVLVSSGKWNAPYVARVVKVMKRKKVANVKWYYLPQETTSKVKRQLDTMTGFIKDREVFTSNHADTIPLKTIIDQCRVLDEKEFKKEMKRIEALPSSHAKVAKRAIYVARYHYDEQAKQLRSTASTKRGLLLAGLVLGQASPQKMTSKAHGARNHSEKKESVQVVPEPKSTAKSKAEPEPEPEPERLSDFEIARRARMEAVKNALVGFGIKETQEELLEKQRRVDEERQKRREEKLRKRMEQAENAEPLRRSLRTRRQPPQLVDTSEIDVAAAKEERFARVPSTPSTPSTPTAKANVWRRKVRYTPAPRKEDMWRVRVAAGDDWMERMRDYLATVEKISETNTSRVMRQVRLMVSGRGIMNPNDSRGIFMHKRKLQVDDNVNELLDLAEEFFDTYGPDYGNGWLVNHPLKKLANFQSYLAMNSEYPET